MSADRLREAAALMRERAEAATPAPEMGPSPWIVDPDEPSIVLRPDEPTGWDGYAVAMTHSNEANAFVYTPHIASWHPLVALAVADWLESAADAFDAHMARQADPERRFQGIWLTEARRKHEGAIAVADAYLGAK